MITFFNNYQECIYHDLVVYFDENKEEYAWMHRGTDGPANNRDRLANLFRKDFNSDKNYDADFDFALFAFISNYISARTRVESAVRNALGRMNNHYFNDLLDYSLDPDDWFWDDEPIEFCNDLRSFIKEELKNTEKLHKGM